MNINVKKNTYVRHNFYKKLQNQRPALVVPPDVSTSVKEIFIGNLLLSENLLVNFLPAPELFRRKDALGVGLRFLIYLFV